MKFRTRPEAEKAAKLVGQPVEWVGRNYGAQRELTCNIRLTDGTEIHNWGQVPMAERTLSQVTKEIDQLATEVNSLEAQIESKRGKLTELVREQIAIQGETLSRFGMRLAIENARDGLPVVTRRTRRSATPKEGGPTTKELRAFASNTGWTYQGESVSKWPNRIPKDALEALRAAYNQAITPNP